MFRRLMQMLKQRESGFTLIELMIVILVILILGGDPGAAVRTGPGARAQGEVRVEPAEP